MQATGKHSAPAEDEASRTKKQKTTADAPAPPALVVKAKSATTSRPEWFRTLNSQSLSDACRREVVVSPEREEIRVLRPRNMSSHIFHQLANHPSLSGQHLTAAEEPAQTPSAVYRIVVRKELPPNSVSWGYETTSDSVGAASIKVWPTPSSYCSVNVVFDPSLSAACENDLSQQRQTNSQVWFDSCPPLPGTYTTDIPKVIGRGYNIDIMDKNLIPS